MWAGWVILGSDATTTRHSAQPRQTMTTQKFEIGQEVIRIDGGYTVGNIGTVVEIDENGRVRVYWDKVARVDGQVAPAFDPRRTWVKPTSVRSTNATYTVGLRKWRDKNLVKRTTKTITF